MGVTEIGITFDPQQVEPLWNWSQQMMLVTQAINVDQGATYSGNFPMGRSTASTSKTSMIESIASLYGKDFDFCLDCGLFWQGATLVMGAEACASLLAGECPDCSGEFYQLPIYVPNDSTWNVAISSFQYGADAVLPQVGMLIFDTTKVFSVFPYGTARAIANGISKRLTGREATQSVVDNVTVFSLKFPSDADLKTPLLINFTSNNPYKSFLAKFLEVTPDNLFTMGKDGKATFNFIGSKEEYIVESPDGPRFYLGTKFMRDKFIVFRKDGISLLQTSLITSGPDAKRNQSKRF